MSDTSIFFEDLSFKRIYNFNLILFAHFSDLAKLNKLLISLPMTHHEQDVSLEIIKLFIEKGADINYKNNTLLKKSCEQLEIVEYILKNIIITKNL